MKRNSRLLSIFSMLRPLRCRRKCLSVLYCVLVVAVLVFLLHPDRNARGHYGHLSRQKALEQLIPQVSQNLTDISMVECDYKSMLFDNTLLDEPVQGRSYSLDKGQPVGEGGEYSPDDCKESFSTAVIVPYRDREDELYAFLIHMHNFLRRQRIHYRIYVVEQANFKPFNRAKLLNIGAVHAMRDGFPCLVLHDVDLLPLHAANIYACSANPRHMSTSINKFRYALPYLSLFGGAVSILSRQYRAINGMSNLYVGWGAEDDDLSRRIAKRGLKICRFDPDVGRYFMPRHKAQKKGPKNDDLLRDAETRMETDGLNSLQYTEISTVLHPLFTYIIVDF